MKIRGYTNFVIWPREGLDKDEAVQFAVFSIKLKTKIDGKSTVKAAGKVPYFQTGDYFEFEGEFDEKGDFQIISCYRADDDEEGALNMMEFCFGKKTASVIVEGAFENDVCLCWECFKNHYDVFAAKAVKVKGVGRKKCEKALDKYESNITVDLLAGKFSKYGLYLQKAMLVYNRWGKAAIEKIEKNPYEMMRINSIPFEVADRIGLEHLGLKKTDSRRVYAAVLSQMNAIMNRFGHDFVWLKFDPVYSKESGYEKDDGVLLYKTAEKLDVDESLVLEEIVNLANEGKLVLDRYMFQEIVYLPMMYEAESGIAKIIKSSIARNSISDEILSGLIEDYQKAKGFRMAEKQTEAVQKAVKNRMSIISGPPGSGKTTIIDCICFICRSLVPDVKIQLAAPTGKAAKRMMESTGLPASTIHRLLEFSPVLEKFSRSEENPIDAELLIIDEFSMNDTMLTYDLLKAVPKNCMIILVGDKDQLPSVGSGKVLEDLLSISSIPNTILDKIYRQGNNSTILPRALAVTQEKRPVLLPASDFAFYEETEGLEKFKNDVSSLFCNEVNEWGLDDVMLLTPMNKGDLGVDMLNITLQDIINPASAYTPQVKFGKGFFRKNDRIIQLVNEPEFEVYNGMIGKIIDVTEGDRNSGTKDSFSVDFGDGIIVDYYRDRFSNVKLAYALTIHKCQGSEAKSVIMICDKSQQFMLRKKLLYTGMTRAKKRLQMIGQKDMIYQALSRHEVPRNSRIPAFLNC